MAPVFYSSLRQSNLPEALERRSVRFSVREMNTLIEPPFNLFKLDFILLCRLATNRGTKDRSRAELWNKWASTLVLIKEAR